MPAAPGLAGKMRASTACGRTSSRLRSARACRVLERSWGSGSRCSTRSSTPASAGPWGATGPGRTSTRCAPTRRGPATAPARPGSGGRGARAPRGRSRSWRPGAGSTSCGWPASRCPQPLTRPPWRPRASTFPARLPRRALVAAGRTASRRGERRCATSRPTRPRGCSRACRTTATRSSSRASPPAALAWRRLPATARRASTVSARMDSQPSTA
mmetsp:Transcript_17444/g.46361  ORF Transcript_17444/g.46361 Transcript_17444/m.46361 type:complete len:214 (+) Transcript_17444:166-807(+)